MNDRMMGSLFGGRDVRWGRAYETLVGHIIGLTLAVAGFGIAGSGVVDAMRGGPDVAELLIIGVIVGSVGLVTWRFTTMPQQIRILDVFTTVTLAWVSLAIVGALPYWVTGWIPDPDDALFESIAGFTTTGSTVLRPIEGTGPGVLFWRSITQWMGGMGVIVLVVAVLPTVGSGGMSLLEAEAPGPTGERLTPRVRQTARRLWAVYIGFTILLALAYLVAGMSVYDAVAHSFTTVSTGGFSPYNASLGHFESGAIEWICIVAMFIAGTSFTLIYRLLRGSPGPLLRSKEFRVYVLLVASVTAVLFAVNDAAGPVADRIRASLFTTLTVVSTTGYATEDYGAWSDAAQAIVLLLLPIGAMAGSTAGGVKLIRVLAVGSYAHREALRQLHPRLVRPVRVGGIMPDRTADKIVGFLVLALATFGGGAIAIALTGTDVISAFSAAATAFGNVGPGLGDVGPSSDFLELPRLARWVTMVQMLLGRLEIYPVILALSFITLRRRYQKLVV
ncbi:MAG: TrkH family potassium uptake protein [Ilumatobacter sp.]|uniref:TrkH family potassium uptake protein n=1 Tax=Ilumatobacter sp. TaxID=1967498 RepID=UPI0026336B0E|nr:TrkH family potassium uptake protein [Ilumatobacter sp.]MDJ0768532.1 TrkH family potassium uptake protein [Ilumatobacter sp.]